MQRYVRDWAAALSVLGLTVAAVVLDIADSAVRNFWSRHSFSSSVVSGLLVLLLLTVLLVDRVNRMRRIKDQSRAELLRSLRLKADDESADVSGRVGDAVERLHSAAAPVIVRLNREERAAVASDDVEDAAS